MIFDLEPIFNNIGSSLSVDYTLDFSDIELNLTKPFVKPISVKGAFKNSAGVVSVCATASFTLSLFCDRCAAAFSREYSIPVEHTLVTQLNDESNDELICIDSFRFELDELVSDDIFLTLPSKFLCRSDCMGLCAECGQNLNEGPCSCKKSVDPRLAGLLQLLDNT